MRELLCFCSLGGEGFLLDFIGFDAENRRHSDNCCEAGQDSFDGGRAERNRNSHGANVYPIIIKHALRKSLKIPINCIAPIKAAPDLRAK